MRPHGLLKYRKEGCRCEVCRQANADLARRGRESRRNRPPGEIPHGYGGYVNYECRCDTCREAAAVEIRRQSEARAKRAEELPHGTATGFTFWKCRCPDCAVAHSRAVMQRAKVKNDASIQAAHRHRQEWTGPELEVAARTDLTHREVAEMLGRSIAGVRHVRRKLRDDPKTILHAGIGAGAPY